MEGSRQFGGYWLGLVLLRQLGLPHLLDELLPQGREGVCWNVMAQVLVLGHLEWSKRDDWRDWARLSEGCYLLAATSPIGAAKSFGVLTYN